MPPRTAAALRLSTTALVSVTSRACDRPLLWWSPRSLPSSPRRWPPVHQTRSIVLEMAKTKPGFYAVRLGRTPGVYTAWDDCQAQVTSFPQAAYKKFSTRQEAEAFAFPRGASISTTNNNSQASASTSKRSRAASTPSGPPAKKTKPEPATTWSHTASTVTPSEYDPEAGLWKTSSGRIVVYTDGSSLGNGQRGAAAGLGVWWADGSSRNVSERVPGSLQTNNRGELLAIIRAIETAPDSSTPLEIRTDSQYSIKCMVEWLPGWRRRNFKTKDQADVSNLDLIQHLAALIDLRRKSTSSLQSHALPTKQYDSDSASSAVGESSGEEAEPEVKEKVEMVYVNGVWKAKRAKKAGNKSVKETGAVKFTHVKAHVGLRGNEEADALANAGAVLPMPKDRQFGAKFAKLDGLTLPSEAAVVTSTSAASSSSSSSKPSVKPAPKPEAPAPAAAAVDWKAPYGYTKSGRVRKKPLKSQRESDESGHDSSHTEATDSSDEFGLDKSGDEEFWRSAAEATESLESSKEGTK